MGGVERQMLLIAQALSAAGVAVECWTTTPDAVVPPRAVLHQRSARRSLVPYLTWLVASVAAARWRARRTRPVVVVARVSAESLVLALLGRLLGMPVVVFLTGGDEHGSEFLAQRRDVVRRVLLRCTDAFVAHATVFLDEVRDAGFVGRCERIPTIVGEPEGHCAERLPEGHDVIVWCGRAEPVKNLPFMIELVERGFLAPSSLSLITTAPVAAPRDVAVHVGCPAPRTHFASVGAIALPSLIEGQSNVLAEAAVVGTPTVAFATGGSPEIISDLACGETVDRAEAALFAKALERVTERFSDPNERTGLEERAVSLFVEEAPRRWVDLVKDLGS